MSDELAALERDYAYWQKAIDEGRVQTGDFILGRLTPALLDAFPGLVQRLRKAEADLFLSNQLALEDWTSSRQRIAALRLTENATAHKGKKTQ